MIDKLGQLKDTAENTEPDQVDLKDTIYKK